MDVQVTQHALDRWLERCAQYANEDGKDILKAFGESKPADIVPFHKKPDTKYFYHAATNTYFACETAVKRYKIVTVLVPGVQGRNMATNAPILVSKRKKSKSAAALLKKEKPEFASLKDEIAWLKPMIADLNRAQCAQPESATKHELLNKLRTHQKRLATILGEQVQDEHTKELLAIREELREVNAKMRGEFSSTADLMSAKARHDQLVQRKAEINKLRKERQKEVQA